MSDEEHEMLAKKESNHWREITHPDVLAMSMQKGPPGLPGRSGWPRLSHVFLNGPFTDMTTQLEQFTADPFGTPQTAAVGR